MVVSRPDARTGRGRGLSRSPVAAAAVLRGSSADRPAPAIPNSRNSSELPRRRAGGRLRPPRAENVLTFPDTVGSTCISRCFRHGGSPGQRRDRRRRRGDQASTFLLEEARYGSGAGDHDRDHPAPRHGRELLGRLAEGFRLLATRTGSGRPVPNRSPRTACPTQASSRWRRESPVDEPRDRGGSPHRSVTPFPAPDDPER